MSSLLLGTTIVSPDEPCLGLYELHMQSPNSRGFRRYQIVMVMRGDHPAEARRDMGPASKFKHATEFRIPGGARDSDTGRFHVEHTVGELVDIADALRSEPQRAIQPSVSLDGLHQELERRDRRRRGVVNGR